VATAAEGGGGRGREGVGMGGNGGEGALIVANFQLTNLNNHTVQRLTKEIQFHPRSVLENSSYDDQSILSAHSNLPPNRSVSRFKHAFAVLLLVFKPKILEEILESEISVSSSRIVSA
jgi:hypothetical protein